MVLAWCPNSVFEELIEQFLQSYGCGGYDHRVEDGSCGACRDMSKIVSSGAQKGTFKVWSTNPHLICSDISCSDSDLSLHCIWEKPTTSRAKIIEDDPNQTDIGEVATRVALAVVDRRIILGTPVEVGRISTGSCEVTACKHLAVQPTKSIVKGRTTVLFD